MVFGIPRVVLREHPTSSTRLSSSLVLQVLQTLKAFSFYVHHAGLYFLRKQSRSRDGRHPQSERKGNLLEREIK